MKLLSHEEVQRCLIDILDTFDRIARNNDIRYSLGAGTLLGAARHKGFIPWDDDIDLYVPRPDYDRLVEMARSGLSIGTKRLVGFEIDNYPIPFMKMVDMIVHVNDPTVRKGLEQHLWIDIFPLDGLPDDAREVDRLLRRAGLLRYLVKIGNYKLFGAERSTIKVLGLATVMPLVRLFRLNNWAERRLIELAKTIPYNESKTVGNIVWNAYGAGEAVARTAIDQTSPMQFEGSSYFATKRYDEWLRGMYGDYMVLPPEEQRTAHSIKAWTA